MTLHPFQRMLAAAESVEEEFEEFFRAEYDRLEAAHGPLPDKPPLGSAVPHKPKIALTEYIAHQVEAPTAVHRKQPPYGDAWLNLQLGTCGEGMAINGVQTFHAEAGTPIPPFTDDDAEELYEIVGGYNPKAPQVNGENPTDQGTDNNKLVAEWKHPGISCGADGTLHTIEESLFVDPADENLTRLAMWEFVVCFRAYGLPETAQSQQGRWTVMDNAPSGATALGSWGYHDIAQTSYGPRNVGLKTWGMPWMAAWPFDSKYGVQGFVVTTPEQTNLQGISPAGIDWTKLNADLAAMRSNNGN